MHHFSYKNPKMYKLSITDKQLSLLIDILGDIEHLDYRINDIRIDKDRINYNKDRINDLSFILDYCQFEKYYK